jgi:hypothetical protein
MGSPEWFFDNIVFGFIQNPTPPIRRTSQQSCLSLFELFVLLMCGEVALFRATRMSKKTASYMQA